MFGQYKCGKCGEFKPESDFHKDAHWCKVCANKASAEHYRNNKDRKKVQQVIRLSGKAGVLLSIKGYRQRLDLKRQIIKVLGGKCAYCGYDKNIKALDFHHHNTKVKEFNISERLSLKNIKKLHITMKELENCLVLCANCHRELHDKLKIKELSKRCQRYDIDIDKELKGYR